MRNEEVLILTVSKDSMTYSLDAIELGYLMSTIFKNRNTLAKLISKINLYTKFSFGKYFFNSEWKSKLNEISQIIIVAHPDSVGVIKYLNQYFPNIYIHVWYNNPVKHEISPDIFKKLNCKVWSFDKKDCESFGLFYNNQYVDIFKFKKIEQNSKKYDVVFVGKDKGRLEYLLSLRKIFEENNLITYFYIVDSNDYNGEYEFQEKISYSEVINLENNAKAILEINQKGQSGSSLRALEALIMRIKLITNNQNVKEELYYNKKNIFILGEDNLDELSTFLSSSFNSIPNSIINHYIFEGWIKKFDN
jgi:hypothetical protein